MCVCVWWSQSSYPDSSLGFYWFWFIQLKKDSDEKVNGVDLRSKTRVADEDDNSDDDADMDIDIKNISVSLDRNVTVVDKEQVPGSSKKIAVQESDIPEVSHFELSSFYFSLFGLVICWFFSVFSFADSETLWTDQFLYGYRERYIIFIWGHDGN